MNDLIKSAENACTTCLISTCIERLGAISNRLSRWFDHQLHGFAPIFPRLLLAWDPTGVPLNPPRSLSPFDIYRQTASDGGNGPTYTLTVGDNGLFGVKPLF